MVTRKTLMGVIFFYAASVTSAVIIMSDPTEAKRPSSGTPVLILEPRNTYVIKNKPATLTCRALHAKRIRFRCDGQWVDQKEQVNKEGVDSVSGLAYFETSIPVHRSHIEQQQYTEHSYSCECIASGEDEASAVKSGSAVVKIAYLRKHFYSEPASEHKPVGSTIQLRCFPPDGDPKPEVYWLKNGEELRRGGDTNVILANDGSMIVSAARLTDSGNYTCGARNIATKRLSSTALVSVYVDGGWSDWSKWIGDCDIDCRRLSSELKEFRERGSLGADSLIPKVRRYRTCNSPMPKNGGSMCSGFDEEHMDCPLNCPIDGAWTPWSEWSECNRKCHRYRTRKCSDPTPKSGGRECKGSDFDTKNCSKNMCSQTGVRIAYDRNTGSSPSRVGDRHLSSPPNTTGGTPVEVSIAMYAGLAAFAFLFMLLLVLVVWLLTRRQGKGGSCNRRRKDGDIYYTDNAGQLRTVLSIPPPPDLSRNALLAHPDGKGLPPERDESLTGAYAIAPVMVPPSDMGSFSLHNGAHRSSSNPSPYGGGSKRSGLRNIYSGVGSACGSPFVGSKAALLENGSSGSGSTSSKGGGSHPPSIGSGGGDKPHYVSRNANDEHYATLYDYGIQEEERENLRNSLISSAYLAHVDVDSLAINRIDHRGGRLSLPHCSISLTVPEGALVEQNKPVDFYIAVCTNLADRPHLPDRETLVSPVVLCGPPGVVFRKPVVLTLPHCARLFPRADHWRLSVLISDDASEENSRWMRAVTIGEETVNTEIYSQVDQETISLLTDQLCRYAIVGSTAPNSNPAVKRMKLLAFAPLYPSSLDYSLRVYCIQDTDAGVQAVMNEEQRLGGYLVTDERNFSCQEGGDMCFCVEDVSAGWQVKPGANYQEIPAQHLWSSDSADRLHCSFSLESTPHIGDPLNRNQSSGTAANLAARIVVYQKGAPKSRQIIQVNTALAPIEHKRLSSSQSNESGVPTLVTSNGASNSSQLRHCEQPYYSTSIETVERKHQFRFKLPSNIKRHICQLLDPPMEAQNDWRMLAKKLNVDRYIQFFGLRASPTEQILDLWEARESSSAATVKLLQTLRTIGRSDAASLIEDFLDKNPVPL